MIITPIDILIVTALDEELASLATDFDLQSPIPIDDVPISYYLNQSIACSLGSHTYSAAVFCLNGMGNTNAAVDVSNALQYLSPTYVVMFGIAAGIETGLADVILPDQIFYTALEKQHPDRRNVRPESMRIDSVLLERFRAYYRQARETKEYTVRIGPFAVGEQVIANKEKVAELRKIHPKMLGIEMESYGVALAVSKSVKEARFIAVRGVSDNGDDQKSDVHRGKALRNAADFLLSFIRSGLLPKKSAKTKQLPKFVAIQHLSLYRRQSVHQAITAYLTRLQTFDVIELAIDQLDLYHDDSMTNPSEALERQREALARLDEILREYPECELGYFGLAHVPLMFHLGYEINHREVQLFGNEYNGGKWIDLPDKTSTPNISIEGVPEHMIDLVGDMILLMSVSYLINTPEPDEIVGRPLARIHIRAEKPMPGIVDSKEILDRFTEEFRSALHQIITNLPNVRRVHLFFAGQPTLAFRCGQQINRNTAPEIIVYNYSRRDHPSYRWALNLQTSEIIERE